MANSMDASSAVSTLNTVFDAQVTVRLHLVPGVRAYRASISPNTVDVRPQEQSRNTPPRSDDLSQSRSTVAELSFDFDKLPQPSFLGSILGGINANTTRDRVIGTAVSFYPSIYPRLGRAPTQEESDILAQHIAQGIQRGSIGPFVGSFLGITRAELTWLRGVHHLPLPFRVPFNRKRGEGFNPEVFKIMGREVARGPFATTLHRTLRSTLYGFVGYTAGTLYYNYRYQSSIANAALDPRLAEIGRATREAAEAVRSEIKERLKGGQRPRDPARRPSPADARGGGPGQNDMNEQWDRQGSQQGYRMNDDASPTSGTGGSDDFYGQSETANEDRYAQPSRTSESESYRERASEYQAQLKLSEAQNQARMRTTQGEDDDFFQSSTSSSGSQTSATPPQQPAGNSWERLRRGGGTPAAARQRDPPASPASSTSDFGDEKSQAQKEFDAMLERERAGDGSNRSTRW